MDETTEQKTPVVHALLPRTLPAPDHGLLRVLGLGESAVGEHPRHVGVEVPQFGRQSHGKLRVERHQGDFEVVELRGQGAVQQRDLQKIFRYSRSRI